MKKNILVLALLGLSMSGLVARQRDVLTNGQKDGAVDTKKQKEADRLKKQKEAARLKKEQDDAAKAADKAARAEEARLARAANREAAAAEKEAKKAAKKLANPDLTKKDHKVLAQVHTVKAEKLAAQVQDITDGLENLKTKRRAHTSAHKDRVANTPDEVKQSHLLNVRYAPTRAARKAAAQGSCEAHGTCKTAQVQDLTDAIVAQRAQMTDLNAQHQNAKDKALKHHANAGTLDQHQEALKMKIAKAQVAGVKEVKGTHRLSNDQKEMADRRDAARAQGKKSGKNAKKVANVAELQAKVRRVEAMIAQARQEKATYLANLAKKEKQTKRLAQAQPKKWSAPKLSPVV